jgi:alkylation response protein AidB-like acyl-CoA dehydrogenase
MSAGWQCLRTARDAQRALSDATDYAREREVGRNRVTDFQGIQWLIADCYALLYSASLVRDRAANLVAAGKEHAFEASMAKKLAIDVAEKTINDVFSLIGGYGLYHDKPYGQMMFDIKTLRIGGGSPEVLRNYVAQQILKSDTLRGLK